MICYYAEVLLLYRDMQNLHIVCMYVYACMRVCVYVLVSSRLIDASMYRDTCHPICIAIQFATIAIPVILQHYCVFYLNVSQT